MLKLYNDLSLSLEEHRKSAGQDGDYWTLRYVMMYMYGFESEEEMISHLKNGQEVDINDLKCVARRKERLEAILLKDNCEIDEVWEGLKLTKEWLQELETNLFSLLPYLVGSAPQSEAEKAQFKEFKTRLDILNDSKNGRVPIIVYRILAAMEAQLSCAEELNLGSGERMNRDVENDQLLEMILSLEFVLSNISSTQLYTSGRYSG